MKKLKRSARLVEMTQYLLARPHTLISLTAFAERYQSAKSSISEDLAIIKEVFEDEGIGELNTLAGAAGGVRFVPKCRKDQALEKMASICRELEQPERLLPGGYLYMTDLLEIHTPSSLDRQSRSRSRPRRIQVLTVPIGSFIGSATSLCDRSW